MKVKYRTIAFYLPQYYPTETNEQWYGKGFTEWTNVSKAKPLFQGHYQPKVPKDLGYYDLRYPEIKEQQAKMAREAGIEGFCYYHYWFGAGRRELDYPFSQVVESGKPNFPFCLCWANQSWYSKFWNGDSECNPRLIVEQKYDNEEGMEQHFYALLPAFKDRRYMQVDGKLIFMIYRPLDYLGGGVKIFIKKWQQLAKENGLGGFFFMGQATNEYDAKHILTLGFDGINIVRKDDFLKTWKYSNSLYRYFCKFKRMLGFAPYHYDYRKVYKSFVKQGIEKEENIYPTLIPNWDHSPRSGKRAVVLTHSTPKYFKLHILETIKVVKHKVPNHRIIFLKSWNEWGEGNYVEPDLRYGKGYLEALREVLITHEKQD